MRAQLQYFNLHWIYPCFTHFQTTDLPLSTVEDLCCIVDIIFEKAVAEPIYSATYAMLCQRIYKVNILFIYYRYFALSELLFSPFETELIHTMIDPIYERGCKGSSEICAWMWGSCHPLEALSSCNNLICCKVPQPKPLRHGPRPALICFLVLLLGASWNLMPQLSHWSLNHTNLFCFLFSGTKRGHKIGPSSPEEV